MAGTAVLAISAADPFHAPNIVTLISLIFRATKTMRDF